MVVMLVVVVMGGARYKTGIVICLVRRTGQDTQSEKEKEKKTVH